MIVNLARRDGDNVVLERIEGNFLFEGGEAQEGVLVTFEHAGSEVTGRVINVAPASFVEGPDPGPDAGPVVEIELVDDCMQDRGGEIARANLPPGDDTDTNI
ncbi:MAG TPA: hypothetical protein VFC56_05435 [Stellaceae bacterium]|nr:hypothetical protein [Stellaceae bacterium]